MSQKETLEAWKQTFLSYWRKRGITKPFPFDLRFESWVDQNMKREVHKLYAYYFSQEKEWQRSILWSDVPDDQERLWQRLDLPDWMVKKKEWLYIPRPYSEYAGKILTVNEGIPDTLTWWEVGIPAIGIRACQSVVNVECQQQILRFLKEVEAKGVIVVPDGDRPNWFFQDNVGLWYKTFERLLKAYPLWYVDWRALQKPQYNNWKNACKEFWQVQKRKMNGAEIREWEQHYSWKKLDTNQMWQNVKFNAQRFTTLWHSVCKNRPTFPNTTFPNVVQKTLQRKKSFQPITDLQKVIDQVNEGVGADGILRYLCQSFGTSSRFDCNVPGHGKQWRVEDQCGLFVTEDKLISRPSESAGGYGIVSAVQFVKTGRFQTKGREFWNCLQEAAQIAGVSLK